MNINIQIVLMTLAATMGAILLAAYFTLRGRLVLAGVCLLCFFALLRPSVVYAGEACVPIRYADGDTFSFMRNGALVRVRVAGFDAPERAQPFGQAAEARLQLLTRAGAMCDCYKADRHGRSVCTVHTRQGANVATLMLQAGFGCIDERFEAEASAQDREAARAALAQAQAQRVGMWAQTSPVCGMDFRRQKNAEQAPPGDKK